MQLQRELCTLSRTTGWCDPFQLHEQPPPPPPPPPQNQPQQPRRQQRVSKDGQDVAGGPTFMPTKPNEAGHIEPPIDGHCYSTPPLIETATKSSLPSLIDPPPPDGAPAPTTVRTDRSTNPMRRRSGAHLGSRRSILPPLPDVSGKHTLGIPMTVVNTGDYRARIRAFLETTPARRGHAEVTNFLSYVMKLKNKFFLMYSIAEQEQLARVMTYEACEQGSQIFALDDVGDKFYIVLKGIVKLGVPTQFERDVREGDHFGELALLDAEVGYRMANATAVTKCELGVLCREA